MNLEGKISGLTEKTEKIQEKLSKFLQTTSMVKDSPLDQLEHENINVIRKWVKDNMQKRG